MKKSHGIRGSDELTSWVYQYIFLFSGGGGELPRDNRGKSIAALVFQSAF